MLTEVEALERRRERFAVRIADAEYVARFHEYMREWRDWRSQEIVAMMADVSQSYISRVESGRVLGIGCDALRRILQVYEEMECASRH